MYALSTEMRREREGGGGGGEEDGDSKPVVTTLIMSGNKKFTAHSHLTLHLTTLALR